MPPAMWRVIERLGRNGPYWALAFTCLLGWLFKAQCGAAWTGAEQYVTGCYSDAVPFWGLRGVAAGQVPYLEARMEYPVLTGALIWAEGLATRLLNGARADAADFLTIVTLVNAVLALLVLEMMRAVGVGLARQYAWALAPPIVLYLGHNWDMLAVTLAVAAVLAAARGEGVRGSALAALGGAAKLFPVLLLPLLGLRALLRAGQPWRARIAGAAWLVLVAVAAWGAVNAPVAWLAPANWREFYAFSAARTGTAGSVWTLLDDLGWWRTGIAARNLWSFVLFAGGAAVIVAAGWRRHRARPWLLFMPVLAWFLLTNKVYSPQFDLWLWPLVVLTGTRVRAAALFLLGDLFAYFAEFWMFAALEGAWPGATMTDVATAALVRGAAMLWLIHGAVRDPAPAWVTAAAPASFPAR
jgi:uncharacterized membrane protein